MAKSTHVIVIGGSIAGLLAARVLSEFFAQVTILERDQLPESAEFRHGVPQSRHLHAFLARGEAIMVSLFPGLDRELDEIGAPRIRWGVDTVYHTNGGAVPKHDLGFTTHLVSRNSLEWLVRQHVLAIPNVKVLEHMDVQQLEADAEQRIIIGVRVTSRQTKETKVIFADLVVDASGRTSKAPDWLQALGYDAPKETTINGHLGYATRWYQAPKGRNWRALMIQSNPDVGLYRGGGAFFIEDEQLVVTIAGANGDYAPTEEAAFIEFAKSLQHPELYETIKEAQPISPIYGYRTMQNRMRHYEQLARFPERFLVMGDAACAFNPLYGQGMTVAAIEAMALRDLLAKQQGRSWDGLGRRFQKLVPRLTRDAWQLATSEDLRYPNTEGASPNSFTKLIHRYTDMVVYTVPRDVYVMKHFVRVNNMQQSSTSLIMNPRILLSVLWHNLARRRHPAPQATQQTGLKMS